MPIYRRVADLVTVARALLAPFIVWLGHTRGEASLSTVVYIILGNWIADHVDGTVARLDPDGKVSWLGRNDLKIDVFFAVAVAVYLAAAGFVPMAWALAFLSLWLLYFVRYGVSKAAGILFQVLVYGYLLWPVLRLAPASLLWVFGWAVILLVWRWQRVVHELIPETIEVLTRVLRR